jgi:hypothetical protein
MTVKKKAAGGLAALSAVLPFALDMPRAAAFEQASVSGTFEHRFRDTAGNVVTCQVSFSSFLSRGNGDPTFDALSTTRAFTPEGGPGCNAFLEVEANYIDSDGSERSSTASATANGVNLVNHDVVTDYVASHAVFFSNCISDCVVHFETRPK